MTITVERDGETQEKKIKVTANEKTALEVCADDVEILKTAVRPMEENSDKEVPEAGLQDTYMNTEPGEEENYFPQQYHYRVEIQIKNNSSYAAKKVEITGRVAGENVQMDYKDFFPGKGQYYPLK